MHKNAFRKAVQTNFARVKHVSGKDKISDILTKEDKDKLHYITPQYRLMSKLTIMVQMRLCIHIDETICVIPMYGYRYHHNSSPKRISDADST